MSSETVHPPGGPAGADGISQPETSPLLLDISPDACDADASGPPSSHMNQENYSKPVRNASESKTASNHVTKEDRCQPIRTQPHTNKSPIGAAVDRTAIYPGVSNAGTTCKCTCGNVGRTTPASVAPATQQPSTPVSQKVQRKLRSSLSMDSDSSRRSKGSSMGSQKPPLPEADCCVHCILACLFCEFLTLCNMVVAPASCGPCASEACCGCCCCAEDMGEDCCNCTCDMDCGIMDACCESSDCLEICMECCGICFPS
ncbi:myoD family inhibitor domain-containing protein-like isoform X1 [Nerophis ophidion]|uniref:myoD family inhibitor domain-containing protein-like isoform X1 n=1 Tax=Nerophis ophidion TaxID=159077 RepID=UPI002ADFE2BE|nr:myoD family inhibitor domain-containing protein-like isoform X1 [Nerophis ophidion]